MPLSQKKYFITHSGKSLIDIFFICWRAVFLYATRISLLFISFIGYSQHNRLELPPPKYYIFKLSKEQIKKYYDKKLDSISYVSDFHTLVDSGSTYDLFKKPLKYGYYIFATLNNTDLACHIEIVQKYKISLLNNSSDLRILVSDSLGRPVPNLKVKANNRKLRFDEKSQTYFIKKHFSAPKISIEDTEDYYFEVKATNAEFFSPAKKIYNSIFLKSPLRFVYKPIRYLVCLPYGVVKLIVKGKHTREIYQTNYFFNKLSRFHLYKKQSISIFNGFILSNKPVYKPNDTLKISALIFCKKNRHYDKNDVLFTLSQYNNRKVYTFKGINMDKGIYESHVVLHDSLNLKLDEPIDIVCSNNENSISGYKVKYSHYQLKGLKLDVKAPERPGVKEKDKNLFIRLTDINGLNVLDGKVKILVKFDRLYKMYDKQITLANDTLLYIEKPLESVGDTKFTIKDSLFPKADVEYSVHIEAFNAEYEKQEYHKTFTYHHIKNSITVEDPNDSLFVNYWRKGLSVSKKFTVTYFDDFDRKREIATLIAPCKIAKHHTFKKLLIKADSADDVTKLTSISNLAPEFRVAYFKGKPFVLYSLKKATTKFSYVITKDNNIIHRGYTDSIYYQLPFRKRGYNLQYAYTTSTEQVSSSLLILKPSEKKLNINVVHPESAFPGQEVEFKIKALNEKGKPIPDLNLLSLGIDSKFETTGYKIQLPSAENHFIPVYVKRSRQNYNSRFHETNVKKSIDFNFGRHFAFFDSLSNLKKFEIYKLQFSDSAMSQYRIKIDSDKIEFAPYVFFEGKPEPVQSVHINSDPVFYSFCENQPYSILVDKNEIFGLSIRTNNHYLYISKILLAKGYKTILSFNLSKHQAKHSNLLITKTIPYFSIKELYDINNSIIRFRYLKDLYKIVYLKKNDVYYPLPSIRHTGNINNWEYYTNDFIMGPFKIKDKISFHTKLIERNIPLEVVPKCIQQIEFEGLKKILLHPINPRFDFKNKFNEQNINEINIDFDSLNKLIVGRPNPTNNLLDSYENILVKEIKWDGNKLILLYPKTNESSKFIVMFLENQRALYKISNYNTYEEIKINKGSYRLKIFINQQKAIVSKELIEINTKNRINYINIDRYKFDTIPIQNALSNNSYIINLISEKNSAHDNKARFDNELKENVIKGKIISAENSDGISIGDPLVGVTIAIKVTNKGTVTDIDGEFVLEGINKGDKIIVSYIGFATEEIKYDGYKNYFDIELEVDSRELDEVVAVGYGTQTRKNFALSVSLDDKQLQTTIYSDPSQALQGRTPGVSAYNPYDVNIRGVGSINGAQPLYVVNGKPLSPEEVSKINPDEIEKMEVLTPKDNIYGKAGENGIMLITLKKNSMYLAQNPSQNGVKNKELGFTNEQLAESFKHSGIRKNFRDYAFWKPSLFTDKDGAATFKVKLPDDITKWQIHTIAYKNPQLAEIVNTQILSAKPLAAVLPLPQYLTQGDTAMLVGKAQNYFPQEIDVTTKFSINDSLRTKKSFTLSSSHIDTLLISSSKKDSLKIKYELITKDNFSDGEERTLEVFPKGYEQYKNQFHKLKSDTSFTIKAIKGKKIAFKVLSSKIGLIEHQIQDISSYRYLCNEQLASKLKALLVQKKLCDYKKTKFKGDDNVKWIINKLLQNRTEQNLWSWWSKTGNYSIWISKHVTEALLNAKSAGYSVAMQTDYLKANAERLLWYSYKNIEARIELLDLLSSLDVELDYKLEIKSIDSVSRKPLNIELSLLRLKQKLNLPYTLDTIYKYSKVSYLGNLYWEQKNSVYEYFSHSLINTILVYEIVKNHKGLLADNLKAELIEDYIVEYFQNNTINTYESSLIIERMLPYWISSPIDTKSSLYIENITPDTLKSFPYEKNVYQAKDEYRITKTGKMPLYLFISQKYWETVPSKKADGFSLKTRYNYSTDSVKVFQQGKSVKQNVSFKTERDYKYVMLDVPIPAGCEVVNKNSYSNGRPYHVEYYKEKVSIFYESLPKGNYSFELELLPRYKGKYVVNPVSISLMYMPEKYAQTGTNTVSIK